MNMKTLPHGQCAVLSFALNSDLCKDYNRKAGHYSVLYHTRYFFVPSVPSTQSPKEGLRPCRRFTVKRGTLGAKRMTVVPC